MYIRQLRYFISVAEHLSFTEAARHIYVAQSAVSQQIADLEKSIGVKLFIRDKRTVQLMNAGAVLLKEAVSLVNKSSEVVEKVRHAGMGITILPKSLKLYSSPSLRFIDIEGEKTEYELVAAWKMASINPSISLFLKELEKIKLQQGHKGG